MKIRSVLLPAMFETLLDRVNNRAIRIFSYVMGFVELREGYYQFLRKLSKLHGNWQLGPALDITNRNAWRSSCRQHLSIVWWNLNHFVCYVLIWLQQIFVKDNFVHQFPFFLIKINNSQVIDSNSVVKLIAILIFAIHFKSETKVKLWSSVSSSLWLSD